MKQIFLSCLMIALMAGCESKEEKEQAKQAELFKQEQIKKATQEAETQAAAKQKEVLLAEEQATNPSTMNNMGVSMQEGKLIIDTNKAKEFFGTMQKNLDQKSKEIDRELKEGNLTITVPVGIEVTHQKVSIDLNKSKSFLESWSTRMEAFAKEFDEFTRVLHEDNQTQNEEK